MPGLVAAEAAHEYTVRIDPELVTIEVEARFSEPVRRVSAGTRDAARYLLDASDCESGRTLDSNQWRIALPDRGGRCLRYRFDLRRAALDDRRNDLLDESNVLVSPSLWLWRPRGGPDLDIRFHVDDGVQVSVPWKPLGPGHYRLGESPGSGRAVTAFGAFYSAAPRVMDTRLRIAIMKPKRDIDPGGLERWLVETARNITLSYGRFPHPSPQVLAIPTNSWGNSPVPFGRVLR
ncbi:MAG: hypothetical protein QNJ05_13445, partial [Woeseiaceae bacterium]|nr:hypothetical protein [Woeseiaceae bacterium]